MITKKLQKEIHKLAIEKGWYDGGKRGKKELLLLLHTEVAEAVEDYRRKRMKTSESIQGFREFRQDGSPVTNSAVMKPVGFPTEIADIVIRAYDYKGAQASGQIAPESCDPVIDLLQDVNYFLAQGDVDTAIALCYVIATRCGFDLDAEVAKKHEFNRTRPNRHGGKVI